MGSPNLDCTSVDDLMKFHDRHRRGGHWRELFPISGMKEAKEATNSLAHYASNKATAMKLRLKGEITSALMYEGICERIYKDLPEFAKW